MEITILHPYDPGAEYASGIRTAIDGFLRAAPREATLRVVGCTTQPEERPVGRWTPFRMGDREISFFPVTTSHPAARGRIPMSLRFTTALQRFRKRVMSPTATLVFHRLETPLPFLKSPNPKLMFLHYAVPDQVLRKETALTWRHAPFVYFWLERRILPRMDRIFCPRKDGIAWWHAHYPQLRERIQFLPTFVDPSIFHAESESDRSRLRQEFATRRQFDPSDPLVLYVGRFDSQKDPLLLLRAWRILHAEHPRAHLMLVGKGELESNMRDIVADWNAPSNVQFLGTLPHPEIARWMKCADALVTSSATEGMSMSILEALRCGLPVVAPNLGENARLLCRPEAGRLVEGRDPAKFAAALGDLLAQPRDRDACVEIATPYTPERVLKPVFDLVRQHSPAPSNAMRS